MKKDVLVSISGLQYEIDKDEAIEVILAGEYYQRSGKHYVLYEEMLEDTDEVTNCSIKISEKQIDIIKKGASNVHMIFEENKKNTTLYQTPFGDLEVGIFTSFIHINEEDEKIIVDINYGLDINYSYISDCQIQIKITSKKKVTV